MGVLQFNLVLVSLFSISLGSNEMYMVQEIMGRLGDYHTKVIPLPLDGSPLDVEHGLSLKTVLDVEEVAQGSLVDVTFIMWETLAWTDLRLNWANTMSGRLESMHLPTSDIWIPDVSLYNSIAPRTLLNENKAVINSDGSINMISPLKLKTRCPIESGTVNCQLKFGSWTHSGDQLNLKLFELWNGDSVDVSSMQQRPDYVLVNSTAVRNIELYECCPETYVDLLYTITLRKQESNAINNLYPVQK